jgi:hypothetical protein
VHRFQICLWLETEAQYLLYENYGFVFLSNGTINFIFNHHHIFVQSPDQSKFLKSRHIRSIGWARC